MKIQNIVADVRTRVETAGKNYQDAFKAYIDAQRRAVGVVTKNGQTLANTEIGAAKNVFAAARASFDKARTDGVRKVARNPQTYVPNGRDQIISAYKDTIDLLVRTGNELTDVVSSGYKSVLNKLGSAPAKPVKKTRAASKPKTAASSTRKKAPAKTAAKRKTASTRKTTASSTAKSAKTSTATKTTATRKRKTPAKTASSAATTTSSNSADSAS